MVCPEVVSLARLLKVEWRLAYSARSRYLRGYMSQLRRRIELKRE